MTMKKLIIVALIASIGTLSSCGGSKILTQKNTEAQSSFSSGDYQIALNSYEEIIGIYTTNDNSDGCPVYTNAGISAYKVGDYKKAIKYLKLDEFSTFKNPQTLYYLGLAFNKVDNLSLEMLALQDYLNDYPQGEKFDEVQERLYYLYVESDNYDKALTLWPVISKGKEGDIDLIESYFGIYEGLNNSDSCTVIATRLLKLDPRNETALFYKGKKYYRQAEDLYQTEMKAYNAKKTNKQYKKLLAALDIVTADFKKSLGYFKKLYSDYPKPEYANYLSHIYNRLSDEKKSNYYKQLSK